MLFVHRSYKLQTIKPEEKTTKLNTKRTLELYQENRKSQKDEDKSLEAFALLR